MVSCGTDNYGEDVYIAERKWIDMYSTVKSLMASIQNFEINKERTLQLLLNDSHEGNGEEGKTLDIKQDLFEIVYICVKVSYKCPVETSPRIYIYLNDEPQPGATFHMAVKSRGGSDQVYTASFYRGDSMIKLLNQEQNSSAMLNVNLFAANSDVEARNFEVIVHYKSTQIKAFNLDTNNLEVNVSCK